MITKSKITFNAKFFNDNLYNEEMTPPYYHGTTSCAVGFTSFKNYHSLKEIQEFIMEIQKDSLTKTFSPKERNFGERSLLTICVMPQEQQLSENLTIAGFVKIADNLKRRQGYPKDGKLALYLLKF